MTRFGEFSRKFTRYFPTTLIKKDALAIILALIPVFVLDSTVVKFATYSQLQLTSSTNVAVFISFFIVFAVVNAIILASIQKNMLVSASNMQKYLRLFHWFIVSSQMLLSGIIGSIIFQMIFFNKYSLVLLQSSTYLAHVFAFIFLSSMIYLFLGWLRSRKNVVILLFAISFILLSISIVISLLFFEASPTQRTHTIFIRPYPILSIITTAITTQYRELLSTTFDILSVLSFLSIWLATIILLKQYRYTLGRVKFYILITVPLVYYMFPFEIYFGNLLSPLLLDSPVTISLIYVTTFSATKQVGGFLFCFAFLSASNLVPRYRIRNSLLLSAIGMAIVFGSNEIAILHYKIFPPFGLMTEAFLPLGSYLLLIGIFTSATSVAQDNDLRKDFYNSAKSQLHLLKTIGVTQMERQLTMKFKNLEKRAIQSGNTEQQYMKEEDVKKMVRDVLNELSKKKNSLEPK